MELTVRLLAGTRVVVFGKVLTPETPVQSYPIRELEAAKTYQKYADGESFGSLDDLLDSGAVVVEIPPSARITTSAQLRARVADGVLMAQALDGTPLGYRSVLAFSAAFSVEEDRANDALRIDVVGGGGGVPTSRRVDAGTGLTGGGDLSANRTIAAQFGSAAGEVCQGNDARLNRLAGHTVQDRDTSVAQRANLSVHGLGVEDSLGDDRTTLRFPLRLSSMERLTYSPLFAGLTVFDTSLNRLASYDGSGWRVL